MQVQVEWKENQAELQDEGQEENQEQKKELDIYVGEKGWPYNEV